MDELKDLYEDLNNLFANLKIAISECKEKDYKEELLETMRRVQIEIENLEPRIEKLEEDENRELENESERSKIWAKLN